MRKIFYLLLVPAISFCQNLNYVNKAVYKTQSTTSITSPSVDLVSQEITYFDGFAKPIQKIAHQGANSGNDIVLPIEYDGMGRQVKNYLPYATSSPSINYNVNAITDQSNYSNYPGQYPYSEIIYEQSSIERILMASAPGVDWTKGSGHELKFEYKNNSLNEVKLFNAVATWDNAKGLYNAPLSQTTYYGPNTLQKRITKNENWISGTTDNTIEEFTDKSGRLLLEKTYNGPETLETYYVYDQFGNLTYVIPPKADMAITQTVLDKLCYQYKYDNKNRLVEKKLPGKQWEFIVYDKLDRVVATGPSLPPFSNLTQSGWMITKYDVFNRTILTAWMSAGSSNFDSSFRKTKQDERDNETVLNETRTLTTPDVTVSGITFRYTNLSLPRTSYHILTVTYYDDYNYYDAPTVPTTISSINEPVHYNNSNPPKGLITGKWIRASKTSTSYRGELNYTFYDAKARPIRVFQRNHELGAGGYTQIDTKFNYIGQPDYTVKLHKRINSDPGITIKDFYTYSDQNRLLTHSHQVNNGPLELLSSNTYDDLGKLISKNVGGSANAPLQNINYSYNIRNWLTGINTINNLPQSGDPTDLFAFKINYNTVQYDLNAPVIAKQYNGNISETYWQTISDSKTRKYGYKYDKLNRLIHAYYRMPNLLMPGIKSYDEGATYDKNGNIITLSRNGDIEDESQVIEIDELSYSYDTNSNKLLKVTETDPNQTSGFKDGSNTDDDYNYDDNGNLIKDENKGIVNGTSNAIVYNHLNLPIKIFFGTSGTIEYIYDAIGKKIEKIVTQGSTVTTTKYLDGFQYINDVLQFFPTSEGYVTKIGTSYKYIYQYKDNQGNVRLSYTKNSSGALEIIQENNYYPFGYKHSGYNSTTNFTNGNIEAQKYQYNGKECQEELGLNVTAMDFRQYDSTIARFTSIDALTELDCNLSPYVFARNNPVSYNDPSGFCPECEAAYEDVEPYGGQQFTTSTGAVYEFDELSGEWQRIDIKYDLEEVVITTGGKNDDERDLVEAVINLTPIGDLKDIYEGARDGNWWQLASGIAFTAINVATMGSGSLVSAGLKGALKGALKAGGKEILEEGAEVLVKDFADEGIEYLYHYTSEEAAESISKEGLKVGRDGFSYLTNKGNLKPLQAQIELALPVNRALPNSVLKIKASGLNPDIVRRVQGNLTGLGAGGGTEFLFSGTIPANLIQIVK